MGAPVGALEARYTDWMYGHRRGAEVIVRVLRIPHGTETVAIARIDPPLFLGLRLMPRDDGESIVGVTGHRVGYAPMDAAFRVESHAMDRTAGFLKPRRLDGRDLAHELVMLAPRMFVSDTNVQFKRLHVVRDVQELVDDLDAASDIARGLAERRKGLAPTMREQLQLEEWHHFASQHDLVFDPVRMDLSGILRGHRVRICLDSERGAIDTLVSVGLHVPVGVALRVGHQRVGDRLVLNANPEAGVHELLARASPVLLDLARRARDVELTERELFVRMPGPTATSRELERLALASCDLAFHVQPHDGPRTGPYR